MKKLLQNFKMWMIALVGMFAFAGSAMAQTPDAVCTFPSDPWPWDGMLSRLVWTDNGVTFSATSMNGDETAIIVNNGTGTLVISSSKGNIAKVVFHTEGLTASEGTLEEMEWTGSAESIVFNSASVYDVELNYAEVYLEEGNDPEPEPEPEPEPDGNYATITNFTPNATVSLDDNEYGLHYFSLYFDANLTADYGSYSGQSIDGFSLTDAAGNSFALSYVQGWNGSNNVNFASADAITTAGTYTFHAPEGIFTFEGNKVNAELNLVWTLTPAEKFAFGWGDAQAQGTKKEGASEWDPFKTLTGFKVNAPEGVVFDHLAEGVKLQTSERDPETWQPVYSDVEGATVELKDGAVVITLAEAITEQGYYSYVLPEGSVFDTDGRYNKELSLNANVDPYSYFELDCGNPSAWEGLVFETPFNKLVITLPADVTATEVGETFTGSYYQDGNYDLTFNVTGYTQEGQKLTINFTGGDAVPVSTESAEVWFSLSFPQGFVKTADEFYLSSSKSVINNKLVEGEEPTTDENEQIYADWKELVTVTMKAVYDAYEEAPEEDIVGEKPADVTAAVWNYYKGCYWMFYQFENWEGYATGWEAAVDYFKVYGTTLAAQYAEGVAIWEAYENAELVSEPEEVTLEESGVATGAYYYYESGEANLDLPKVPVTYEKYSDGSIILKNFWNSGSDITFKMGHYYEDYDCYGVTIEAGEELGSLDVDQYGQNWLIFNEDLEYVGESAYGIVFEGCYNYVGYNSLDITYYSYTQNYYAYFTVFFDVPFEGEDPTGINTVIATDSNKVYDLSGRRMVKTQKGLNIVNGKVIIK